MSGLAPGSGIAIPLQAVSTSSSGTGSWRSAPASYASTTGAQPAACARVHRDEFVGPSQLPNLVGGLVHPHEADAPRRWGDDAVGRLPVELFEQL